MNKLYAYIIALALFCGMGYGLYWQIQQNGILKQAKAQAEQSLKDELEESAKRQARIEQTDQLLADTQKQYRILDNYALGLANDLENQDGECINTRIPDSVTERVRQYRASSEGSDGS